MKKFIENIKRLFKVRKSKIDIIYSDRDSIDRYLLKSINSRYENTNIHITSVSVTKADSLGKPSYLIAISYDHFE